LLVWNLVKNDADAKQKPANREGLPSTGVAIKDADSTACYGYSIVPDSKECFLAKNGIPKAEAAGAVASTTCFIRDASTAALAYIT
jgi:hypothetical protein